MSTRHSIGLVAVVVSLSSGEALAACPEPVPSRDLSQAVSAGDAAFRQMDAEAFQQAQVQAEALLPCVGEEVTSSQAASLHRLGALSAFLNRDHASTVASFRSLLASAPGYALSEDLAPPNHPLRIDFEVAAGAVGAPAQPLPRPREGWIQVDGRAAEGAPVDRPYVFQHLNDNGQVMDTALVDAGQPAPDFRGKPVAASGRRGVHLPLAVTAGATAVTAGALYFAGHATKSRFLDPGTPDAELQALRSQTNALGWMSFGFGAVAVGAGAGAVLAGSW